MIEISHLDLRTLGPWISISLVGAISGLILFQIFALYAIGLWVDNRTKNGRFFAESIDARRNFKQTLKRLSLLISPILWLLRTFVRVKLSYNSFSFGGVTGPKDACSARRFEAANRYKPSLDDVFVVTQMKCGTTWMQHLVYQILTRGEGDLVETGTALYHVSPWIEGSRTKSIEHAEGVSNKCNRRLIKSHLPASLCPQGDESRFIYVTRHPASCFASAADFVRMNLGPFRISDETLEEWFCSDKMWWSPWPNHVAEWYLRSIEERNVLFVRFEDMKSDLADVAKTVAQFLKLPPLSPQELSKVLKKCSFGYMQQHSEMYEMVAPTLLQSSASPFISGKSERHRDIDPDRAGRITKWCDDRLAEYGLSLNQFYPKQA